jgi:hypothetical protein
MNQKACLEGLHFVSHYDREGRIKGIYETNNGIVNDGIEYLLDVGFDVGTQITVWYTGLVDNAGFTSFANADSMSLHAGWSESTAYNEANRPEWTAGAPASRSITNASTVNFSINATVTIHGIFITSDNVKSGVTGTLWSTAAFTANVAATSGDTLKVTYTLSG